jgi:hypothetical protein
VVAPEQILESEGQRQSKINVAEANKSEVILASEVRYWLYRQSPWGGWDANADLGD